MGRSAGPLPAVVWAPADVCVAGGQTPGALAPSLAPTSAVPSGCREGAGQLPSAVPGPPWASPFSL